MEKTKCIYCGNEVETDKYHIITGKQNKTTYYCCCAEHKKQMQDYLKNANNRHYVLYGLAAILIIINLFFIGYKANFRWMYLPMIGLGILVAINPSVYVTNYFYENMGILKTTKFIRIVGILIAIFGLISTIFYK